MTDIHGKSIVNRLKLRGLYKILKKVNALSDTMAAYSNQELQDLTPRFKERLAQGEELDKLLPEAFAAIREVSKRIVGMYPYDVQVLGAIALHQGKIAEMKTGEGKTLTAVMPLYLNALEGKGVLLVTTNEYLAKRDAEEMGPIFRFMGLTVGVGAAEGSKESEEINKKELYESDVVYTTSSILGFDYLIDNLVGHAADKFLRPFHYAIIDEADAVLLDSAQTPLIIAGSPRVPSNFYSIANEFVLSLKAGEEYELNVDEKYVFLTEMGSRYAESFFSVDELYSDEWYELNRHINLALQAQHLYQKDKDYVVADNEVKLLDNRTGRILEGTRLQSGLHQAIETKEGVRNTRESRAVGSVTYQSLFNMFPRLAGMTGTAKIVEDELIATYRLPVVIIPTNKPIQRIDYPDKIYTTLPEKLYATIEYVKEKHATGQPVLLVSGTVEIAEIYSSMLLQEGIAHSILTAKHLAKEAMVIKEAGQIGTVTVATSLAGRGTDIKLGPGVAELGGLVVVGTERMPSSRVDWQLRGRAGRQGDPGMSQFFVSLEDEIIIQEGPKWAHRYFEDNNVRDREDYGQPLTAKKFRRVVELAQEKSDDRGVLARESTIQFDESLRVQRQLIYRLRDSLIYAQVDVTDKIRDVVLESIGRFLNRHPNLTEQELCQYVLKNFSYEVRKLPAGLTAGNPDGVKSYLFELYEREIQRKMNTLQTRDKLIEFYRLSVLRAIDSYWIEQVDYLQQLKGAVTMRATGQRDTMTEYYRESLLSYEELGNRVKAQVVRNIMLSSIEQAEGDQLSIYFV